MNRHQQVAKLVTKAYQNSQTDFGKWIWKNHTPIVAQKAEELLNKDMQL